MKESFNELVKRLPFDELIEYLKELEMDLHAEMDRRRDENL